MRVKFGLAFVIHGNVSHQRQEFNLFLNRNLRIGLLGKLEEADRNAFECAPIAVR